MSCISLSHRERSALARVSERPRPFGEISAEYIDPLIEHGLVKTALGHYLITSKGQLERQRQVFRTVASGRRAHIDGRRFLFLQETRFQGDAVPRSRIKEWLRARGMTRVEEAESVGEPVAIDPDAETAPGIMDRLRSLVVVRDDAKAAEEELAQKERAMAQLLPVSFYDEVSEQTAAVPEIEFEPKRVAQSG